MKQLVMIFTVLALATYSNDAWSQSRMTEEQKQELKGKHETYRQLLNLTDQQKPQVEAINMEYFEGLASLKDSNASRLTKYKRYKNLNTTHDKKMKSVLDAGQYALYQKHQEEMKEEFKKNRNSR